MVAENRSRHGTAFTVSIEAAEGVQHRRVGARPGDHHPRRHCARRPCGNTWLVPAMFTR